MDLAGVKEYAIKRLNKEIDPHLLYHATYHTLDVYETSEKIALAEKVNEKDIILIKTAALLHDMGFIDSFMNHESFATKIASNVLPGFGYSSKDIQIINNMIMKTKLPQLPETFNEMVLCDADLDYLGRDDFYIHAHKLRIEWEFLGKPTSLIEWYQIQYDFLINHTYFTKYTEKIRQPIKQGYITELSELLQIQNTKKQ
ncbi:HD domain-containing protein [candidate division KSB1 bacterium]